MQESTATVQCVVCVYGIMRVEDGLGERLRVNYAKGDDQLKLRDIIVVHGAAENTAETRGGRCILWRWHSHRNNAWW